jgi:hypothetical protein
MLSEVVSGSLDKKSAKTVMDTWNSRKEEVSKLLSSSTKTSSRKKKDPDAPKKPRSAYILFCSENRPKLQKKSPDLNTTQLTSKLGELWKTVSEKDKIRFNELAKKDKERYESEMQNYTPPEGQEEDVPKKRGGKAKKERTGPKRPTSAYLYFCEAMRNKVKEENPDMSGKDITTELGKRWKSLSEKEKAPYLAKGEQDRARYAEEKGEAPADTGKASKKAPKKPLEEKPKAKKASVDTPGYKAFLQEKKEELESEHPEWGSRKMTAEVNKAWNELSEDDRAEYEKQAQESGESDDESDVELEEESD